MRLTLCQLSYKGDTHLSPLRKEIALVGDRTQDLQLARFFDYETDALPTELQGLFCFTRLKPIYKHILLNSSTSKPLKSGTKSL